MPSSFDNEEYSHSPVSKREYLLEQVKQKDAIIELLLKQVRLHILTKLSKRPIYLKCNSDSLFPVAQSGSPHSSFD
jgi:hypothetical protein